MQKRVIQASLLATLLTVTAAAPLATASTPVEVTEAPMYTVAIDVEQAESVGNSVVEQDGYQLLIDGRTGKEITRVALPGTVTTQNVVIGACGSSYFYLYDDTGAGTGLLFETGFDVTGDAFEFNWYVDITGPDGLGVSWSDRGPKVPSSDWDSELVRESTGQEGTHRGQVRAGSAAYLTNGQVCTSGLPLDSAFIS